MILNEFFNLPQVFEKDMTEGDMYGDQEISWEKGGRRAPTGAFRAPALSAANAAAEYQRSAGGYRGRVDVKVGSREEYMSALKALQNAAQQAGIRIEVGRVGDKMSVFSDSTGSDELGQFVDNTLKQGMAEASPEATFNALKGLKSWQVVIMNNYYRGKYSDYSGRYFYVLATSPEEAKQVVLDNADAILKDLLAMKAHNGRSILPRNHAVRITSDRIGRIEDGTEHGRLSTSGFKKMYSPQGIMMVKLNNGAIEDVQGQEQGVAEGPKDLNELSPDTLASYKKKAGADASAADKRGDIERGNKRFSGIVKATIKQGEQDVKRHAKPTVRESRKALLRQIIQS